MPPAGTLMNAKHSAQQMKERGLKLKVFKVCKTFYARIPEALQIA